MEEMRSSVAPELDLIDSRVVGPLKELQGVLKSVRKTITKRDHKVCDAVPARFPSG
jgi:amphiphysin